MMRLRLCARNETLCARRVAACARYVAACAWLVAACAAKWEPGMEDEGTDAAADRADAAPVATIDAAPPPPDAQPAPPPYPSGPYGTHTGDVIQNIAWQGFFDTSADADADHFNEPAHAVSLEDFFVGRDPASKLLVVTNSAGWCGPCQEEASHLPNLAAEWQPQGVRFLTAMLEDANGYPADTDFAETWGEWFDLTTPVVADPSGLLEPYYFDNGIPFNLFIDTRTMTIVDKMSGWDPGEAEEIFATYVH